MERWVEPAVLRAFVENQAILEHILFYRASKCRQPKSRTTKTVYGCMFFPFFVIIIDFFLFAVKIQKQEEQTVL